MIVSAIAVPLCLCALFYEFHKQGVGFQGWLLTLISAIMVYEVVYAQNFGIMAMIIVTAFAFYAWRNWFVSLCSCLILMAFLENHDTPKGMLGIHGLNPWNLIMINVIFSWIVHRRREGLVWDMPRTVVLLSFGALIVIVWSFLRMTGDYQKMDILNQSEFMENDQVRYTLGWITSDYLINCIKFVLPAVLLYDACRTRQRIVVALATLLASYLLIAIQVNHCMPFRALTADGVTLAHIAGRDLDSKVGYFRTEISMMLAGASWGILTAMLLVRARRHQLMILAVAGVVILGQAMTGGRAGYVTWGLTGLVLGLVRWRKLLLMIPVVVAGICLFLPGVRDRMLQGLGGGSGGKVDEFVMTSGRNGAWSYVIAHIKAGPLFGFGRQAMIREGIYERIMIDSNDPGEMFPHPHNAYLEILLDDGLFGFCLIMPIYIYCLAQSLRLMADDSDALYGAVGGTAAALILGLLFASIGSQSFYPKESAVGMWAAIALMLRVQLERTRSQETGVPLFGEGQSNGGATADEEDAFAAQEATS